MHTGRLHRVLFCMVQTPRLCAACLMHVVLQASLEVYKVERVKRELEERVNSELVLVNQAQAAEKREEAAVAAIQNTIQLHQQARRRCAPGRCCQRANARDSARCASCCCARIHNQVFAHLHCQPPGATPAQFAWVRRQCALGSCHPRPAPYPCLQGIQQIDAEIDVVQQRLGELQEMRVLRVKEQQEAAGALEEAQGKLAKFVQVRARLGAAVEGGHPAPPGLLPQLVGLGGWSAGSGPNCWPARWGQRIADS